MKVHVTRRIQQAVIDRLSKHHDVTVGPDVSPPRAELLKAVADADAILSLLTEKIDEELLAAAPKLKVVSNMAVGVDNIDLAACRKRGVVVGNTPGVLTEATADQAFALLLAAARRVTEGDAYVRSGQWKTWHPEFMLGKELNGATLGIIGYGKIGQAVERRALAFGMKILRTRRDPLDLLLEQSDFVTVHVPLTPETKHLLGKEQLARMRKGSILINTARGSVLDQKALVDALKYGRPAMAALDVTDPEPPRADDELLKLPNVILAPHLGSATTETRLAMANLAADNLLAVLEGKPPKHQVK